MGLEVIIVEVDLMASKKTVRDLTLFNAAFFREDDEEDEDTMIQIKESRRHEFVESLSTQMDNKHVIYTFPKSEQPAVQKYIDGLEKYGFNVNFS